MPYMSHRSARQAGFTLVEMVIIAPIVLLTITAFIGIIILLTGEVLVTRSSNALAHNTQEALNMIEQDVRFSGAFLATNSISPLTSPQGYNNGTQNFVNASATTGSALILRSIAISNSSYLPERSPVWLRDTPNACTSSNVDQNDVMTINIIYFVKDGTLWRRTVMPSAYTTAGCTAPDQRPSCHPDQTAAICVASDVRVLDGVTNFSLQYFTDAAPTSPVTAASDAAQATATRQAALDTTASMRASISATQTVAGNDFSGSGDIRARRAGAFID